MWREDALSNGIAGSLTTFCLLWLWCHFMRCFSPRLGQKGKYHHCGKVYVAVIPPLKWHTTPQFFSYTDNILSRKASWSLLNRITTCSLKNKVKALLSCACFTGKNGQMDWQFNILHVLLQIWTPVIEQVFLSYSVILLSHEISWETSEMAYQNCKPQSITLNTALGQTSVFWIAWHNGDHRIK